MAEYLEPTGFRGKLLFFPAKPTAKLVKGQPKTLFVVEFDLDKGPAKWMRSENVALLPIRWGNGRPFTNKDSRKVAPWIQEMFDKSIMWIKAGRNVVMQASVGERLAAHFVKAPWIIKFYVDQMGTLQNVINLTPVLSHPVKQTTDEYIPVTEKKWDDRFGAMMTGETRFIKKREKGPPPPKPEKVVLSPSLLQMMKEHGIVVAKKPTKAGMKRALLQLRKAVEAEEYPAPAHSGTLASHFAKEPAEQVEEKTSFLAKLNPWRRDKRPQRQPRRSRPQRYAESNPISPTEVDEARRYIKDDKREGQDPEDFLSQLQGIFTGLNEREGPSENWTFDETFRELFPTEVRDDKGKRKPVPVSEYVPKKRLPVLEHGDAVSSVRDFPEVTPIEDFMRRTGIHFWTGEEAEEKIEGTMSSIDYLGEQAGLSLDETKQILQEQKASRQRGSVISPAIAACKPFKVKRLRTYQVPASLKASDRVVLWLSPEGTSPLRVMTIRRGVHLDCDMEGPQGVVLGRAMQSVLFWLAEKGKRQDVSVYLGRIGSPVLYLLWRHPDPISIASMQGKLRTLGEKEVVANYHEERDIEAYEAAVISNMKRVPKTVGLRRRVSHVPGSKAAERAAEKTAPDAPVMLEEVGVELEGFEPDEEEIDLSGISILGDE